MRRPAAVAIIAAALATPLVVPLAASIAPASASTVAASVPLKSISGLACSTADDCIATGYQEPSGSSTPTAGDLYSTNGGKTWTSGKLPGTYATLPSVTCVSSSVCLAVATQLSTPGSVLVTKNATSKSGPTWKAYKLPNASGGTFSTPNSIACPSKSLCYVAGSAASGNDPAIVKLGISSSDKLTSIAEPVPASGDPQYPTSLGSISCRSTTVCVAVGHNSSDLGGAFRLHDGQWLEVETFPSSLGSLWGVSCVVGSEDCYATSAGFTTNKAAVEVSKDNGDHWSSVRFPRATAMWTTTCIATNECIVGGNSSTYGAVIGVLKSAGFQPAKPVAGSGPIYALHCYSSKLCLAAGTDPTFTNAQIQRSTSWDGAWSAAKIS